MPSTHTHGDAELDSGTPKHAGGRRPRHTYKDEELMCVDCGYIGTDTLCPIDHGHMVPIDEVGGPDDLDDADDDFGRIPGNPASLEDLRDEEHELDDGLDADDF